MKLAGKVALITGASRGLGLAIARALGAEGAAIACVARPSASLDRAVEALGAENVRALAFPADVTRDDQMERAVREANQRLGGLDLVILNAGTWAPGKIDETPEAQWDGLVDLNLKGAFLTLRHAVPLLKARGNGTIVGISSLGGLVGQPGSIAYGASKYGLRGLLESVSLDLRTHKIRVSCVYPHNINSEKRAIPEAERDRSVEPEDVAAVVAHVCTAPDHVTIGHVTVFPRATGIAGTMR